MAWPWCGCWRAVPFLALVGLGLSLPQLTPPFWFIVAAMLPLEAAAMLLYMQALRVCHLSLCVPFLAFTPVFLIFTGWLVLGERLNRWGVAGTVLIALGSYILGLGADGNGQDRGPGAAQGPGPRARRPPDAAGGGHLLRDRRPVQISHPALRRRPFSG